MAREIHGTCCFVCGVIHVEGGSCFLPRLEQFFPETCVLDNRSAVLQSTPGFSQVPVLHRLRGLPLRAVLTRPQARQSDLAHHLQSSGWETLCIPALELAPLTGQQLTSMDLPQAHDWIMFVSRTAWQMYWHLAGRRWSPATRIAVVGVATAQAIRRDLGSAETEILTPVPPGRQDSEALWELLRPRLHPSASVLIVAGRDGRTWLRDKLRDQGVGARVLAVYERHPARLDGDVVDSLNNWFRQSPPGHGGVWLMTSQHGIQALQQTLSQQGLLKRLSPAAVLVTHPRLESGARGFLDQSGAPENTPVLIAAPDPESLMRAFDMIKSAMRLKHAP